MPSVNNTLRDGFMRWQCRVRQIMMRDGRGRPGDAVTPALTLAGEDAPMGHIITVMSKAPQYSRTPEMRHMVRKTNDPAQRRESALTFFSEYYYQKAAEFSDLLTATVPPGSPGALSIREAGRVTLTFAAYRQRYDLRFPGLYRDLARAGAEILTVPAAFTQTTGEVHWHVLNRARAIENGAFVVAACAHGPCPGGGATYGHSLIISPWGQVLADGGEGPGVVQATIELD